MSETPTQSWHGWLISDTPSSRRHARLSQFYRQWLAFRRNPSAMTGLAIVAVLLVAAALAPLIATHDPIAQALDQRLLPPSAAHWFGTDSLGRDILSRIIYGTRITLVIVLLVVVTVGPDLRPRQRQSSFLVVGKITRQSPRLFERLLDAACLQQCGDEQ